MKELEPCNGWLVPADARGLVGEDAPPVSNNR